MKASNLNKIAIVGIGGVFPDAKNIEEYWNNIVNKKVSIYELPDELLNKSIFYDKSVIDKNDKNDKSYSKICGLIKNFELNPKDFRIPPKVINQMDLDQQASIYVVKQALESVSLEGIDKEKIGVFIGDGSYGGGLHDSFNRRIAIKEILEVLKEKGIDKDVIENLKKEYLDILKPITEDSAPGTLRNITAARIANVFDFHGPSYTLNSACASGLTAVIRGVESLESGQLDTVICGAADMGIREVPFLYFSAINALSPDGPFPFDERANGFIIGQGAGVVVLKRLDKAIEDGDTIYSIISGYGQASDGKGKAIAAPEPKWQSRTVEQSISMSNFPIDTVEYIEAHGTSTKVGDVVEVNALIDAFSKFDPSKKSYCGLSSVKSNIGHLKSAAGIAGLIKAVMAIHKKTLPPVADFRKLNPKLNIEDSPFYIIDKATEWKKKEHPRRAGVSAFGFGGADYHISLEEFRTEDMIEKDINCYFTGKSSGDIIEQLNLLSRKIDSGSLENRVLENNNQINPKLPFKLSFSIRNSKEYKDIVELFKEHHTKEVSFLKIKGIYYNKGINKEGKIAVMFPGQGAQYPNMMCNLFESDSFKEIDAIWNDKAGYTVSSLIKSNNEDLSDREEELKKTMNTHPAVFATSLSLFRELKKKGLRPDSLIGHSLGEITALSASNVFSLEDSVNVIFNRGKSFNSVRKSGIMAAIALGKEEVAKKIEEFGSKIYIANSNSPEQTIISGEENKLKEFLKEIGNVKSTIIPVSKPFHSPLVQAAQNRFNKFLENVNFNTPEVDVICNQTSTYYAKSGKKIKEALFSQIIEGVNFTDSIKKLFLNGVDKFIEVGPSSILSSLVKKILPGENISIINTNYKNKDDESTLNNSIMELFTLGVNLTGIEGRLEVPKEKTNIVFTGASVGLPGSNKESFRDDNFEQLFNGKNLIEKLSDKERNAIVDLNVTKLIKAEKGASYKTLNCINDVIQLAGKAGDLDLSKYLIPEKEIENMSSTIAMAVAAGYEALRDAKIPLIREYNETASGKKLPGRWVLPQEMQDRTGIIFPNGFPMVDPVITEVSRYVSYIYSNKMQKDLISFYETIISNVEDFNTKKVLTDWFTYNYQNISDEPGDIYKFNHNFMNQIASQANNRFACYIGARGPNFQINAACSSTSTAVSIAEDFIKSGRADRMIVIGGDDPTSTINMPLIGSGFLATGAATTQGDVRKAALPFDKRRNGMIMGSGAIGIVIETLKESEKRGVRPICQVLGSHLFNTAGHPSRIEHPHYEKELGNFISDMEIEHNINRNELASNLIYMSHETYTPARGGCSQTEAIALKSTFGENYKNILITNTKGMTGHTMGASIEDAVIAKSLQYNQCPPIVNHSVIDPELEDLKLSKGGKHNCDYGLKMAAGFGGQGNYLLFKKIADEDNRFYSKENYNSWLKSISNLEDPKLGDEGRLLVIEDSSIKPNKVNPVSKENVAKPVTKGSSTDILKVFSEITGYPIEMLELDMEMEADLGIDTVKQATILSILGEKYGFKDSEDFRLSDYPTIGHIVSLYNDGEAIEINSNIKEKPPISVKQVGKQDSDITAEVLKVFSEITGYPIEMLELDMEMEADLGIDTVKQATILSLLGEKYGFKDSEDFRLSDYPTIGHIVSLYNDGEAIEINTDIKEKPPVSVKQVGKQDSDITAEVLEVFSEITGYPTEMLELEMEMEADLGIDTVKQATILSILGEKYGFKDSEDFRLSDYPTIGHIVSLYSDGEAIEINSDIKEKPPVSVKKASDITAEVLEVFSEITGYPIEMLELDMEIEADLGIDTVKQSIILSILGEKYGKHDKDIKLSDYPTLEHIVKLYSHTFSTPTDHELSRQILVLAEEEIGEKEFELKESSILVIGKNAPFELKKKLDGLDVTFTDLNQNVPNRPVDIIIDLNYFDYTQDLYEMDKDEAKEALINSGDNLFSLYKEMGFKPKKIVVLTPVDGFLAQGSCINPRSGAISGFYKSLRKEWNIDIRILDANVSSNIILRELEHSTKGVEICYINGKRNTIKIINKEIISKEKISYSINDTILVTGGATGITFEIIKEMGLKYKCNFAVIGRTKLPENIEEIADYDKSELEDLKKEIHSKLKANSKRVTPLMLKKEFGKIEKAIHISKNISSLISSGIKAEYISCDITDYHQLEKVCKNVKRSFGDISGIIHGAGVEISHFMDKKSIDEYNLVYNTKVLGAYNLISILKDEPLKLITTFSSISGRFGNAAQLDYSSANSFLNYWVKSLRNNNSNANLISFIWSGWKDVGMAWRNDFVREHSEEQGINLIDVKTGVEAFLKEIENNTRDYEVILHRGLGDLIEPHMDVTPLNNSPLIDRVILENNKIVRGYKTLSVKRDEFINQHRLGDTPLMPAVSFMELCCEYYSLVKGKRDNYVIKDLDVLSPLKLYKNISKEIAVNGTLDSNMTSCDMSLSYRFNPGNFSENKVITFSTLNISDDKPSITSFSKDEWTPLNCKNIKIVDYLKLDISSNQIINFGPLYQDILRREKDRESMEAALGDNGLIYPVNFPEEQITNEKYPLDDMIINPCFLDSIFQGGAIYCITQTGRVYLPCGAKEFGIVNPVRERDIYKVYIRFLEKIGDDIFIDSIMVNSKNEVNYYAKGIKFMRVNL